MDLGNAYLLLNRTKGPETTLNESSHIEVLSAPKYSGPWTDTLVACVHPMQKERQLGAFNSTFRASICYDASYVIFF